MKKVFSVFCVLFLFTTCVKKTISADIGILGLDYYPTGQGKFVVYEVDSTVYMELPRDTIVYKYQIKEKLTESFTDNEGKTAKKLERYIKKYDALIAYKDQPWTIKEVWMVNADDKKIQVVESNIRFTKLVFPVQEGAAWNGNAANSQGEREYVYEYIDRTETINSQKLDNVLLVKQYDYPTLITKELYLEKYAKGVGLVYREIINVRSNKIIAGKDILNRIEDGIVYHQTLVTYGYE